MRETVWKQRERSERAARRAEEFRDIAGVIVDPTQFLEETNLDRRRRN